VNDRRRRAAARWAAILIGAGLLAATFGATSTRAAVPTDVFISEYIEGASGSNAKVLELYNGTGAPINLAAGSYAIDYYTNGVSTPSGTIALTGTVANADVYIIANPASPPLFLALADQQDAALNFNGNDALVLRKGATVVDSIGQVGVDPGAGGWGVDPLNTTDSDLSRIATVTAGDTNPADTYDPAAEWFAWTDVSGLGAHTIDTGGGGGGGGGGSEEGTVTAVLTPQAQTACIELSQTQISFGAVAFGGEAVPATPGITITNCSTASAELLASATDATGGGATWTLVDDGSTCGGTPDLGQDKYRLSIDSTDWEGGPKPLSTQNTGLSTFDAGASVDQTALIWTACPGSSGDGQTMSLQINYLAVLQEE
jgi:hypothetical protein